MNPGPQRERVRSSTPVVADVPLAVVHDIALLRDKTTVLFLELICAVHKLSPQVTESIRQIVKESLSPVRRQQGCAVP